MQFWPLLFQAEALATLLTTKRVFVDTTDSDDDDAKKDEAATAATAAARGATPGGPAGGKSARRQTRMAQDTSSGAAAPSRQYSYDPRFLVFEFTWNLMLRRSQVGARFRLVVLLPATCFAGSCILYLDVFSFFWWLQHAVLAA